MTALPRKTYRHLLIDIARKYLDTLKILGINIYELYSCYKIDHEKLINIKEKYPEKFTEPIDSHNEILASLLGSHDTTLVELINNKGIDRIFLNQATGKKLGLTPIDTRSKWPQGSYASFDRIREIADQEIDNGNSNTMLTRIRDISDNIKEIFIALAHRETKEVTTERNREIYNDFSRTEIKRKDINLQEYEKSMLWKIWDIGTERVVMQSVIFLDGDVITRVSPDIIETNNRMLFELHQDAVQTSIKYWGTLISLVEKIVKIIVSNI